MKIEMEFQGLQELVKAFEDAASDEDIRAVNKKIVEQGEPVVKRIMSGKIPKSADIKLSGRGFGSKSSVTSAVTFIRILYLSYVSGARNPSCFI